MCSRTDAWVMRDADSCVGFSLFSSLCRLDTHGKEEVAHTARRKTPEGVGSFHFAHSTTDQEGTRYGN